MGWPTKYTGEQIDLALEKGRNIRVVNNGWIRIESSVSNPTNLNLLKNPGNYTTSHFINGPDFGEVNISPINISIVLMGDNLYQFITALNKSYVRVSENSESEYGNWSIDQSEGSINPGPSAPISPIDGKTVWMDTSNPNFPTLKIYINSNWESIIPEGSMITDIYDPQGKKTDIFKYIEDTVASISSGSINAIDVHIADNTIHVTPDEKNNWNNSASKEDLQNSVNIMQSSLEDKIDQIVLSESGKIENLSNTTSELKTSLESHSNDSLIHPTKVKQLEWDSKADNDHIHNLDNNVIVDISNVNGDIPLDALPYDVKERVYVLNSKEELYSLKKNPVHNGDTICLETDNGVEWYFVTNDEYLGSEGIINDWSVKDPEITTVREWKSVCYGNGKFVAIAHASDIFAYSEDGINWTERKVGSSGIKYWNSICYGNGKFVAVSGNGTIAFSKNGIDWTVTGYSHVLTSICYGNGEYVVAGRHVDNYKSLIGTSSDGVNWKFIEANTNTDTEDELLSICYGNGKFVAVGYDMTNEAYTITYSTDAKTWANPFTIDSITEWGSVFFANDKFILIPSFGNTFASSTDGIEWDIIQASNIEENYWRTGCYANGLCVIISSSSNKFLYSIDGKTWNEDSITDVNTFWSSICYDNKKYVAVGYRLISGNYRGITATATLSLNVSKAFKEFAVSELNWNNVTNTPTTLAGYGITDAVTKEEYATVEEEIVQISSAIPSEVDLSQTAETHALYVEAANDLATLDQAFAGMDGIIAKLEAIAK